MDLGRGLGARTGLSGEAWVMLCWLCLEMVGTMVSGAETGLCASGLASNPVFGLGWRRCIFFPFCPVSVVGVSWEGSVV